MTTATLKQLWDAKMAKTITPAELVVLTAELERRRRIDDDYVNRCVDRDAWIDGNPALRGYC